MSFRCFINSTFDYWLLQMVGVRLWSIVGRNFSSTFLTWVKCIYIPVVHLLTLTYWTQIQVVMRNAFCRCRPSPSAKTLVNWLRSDIFCKSLHLTWLGFHFPMHMLFLITESISSFYILSVQYVTGVFARSMKWNTFNLFTTNLTIEYSLFGIPGFLFWLFRNSF